MDDISHARLRDLALPVAKRVRATIEALELENIYVRIVQGLRSWVQQAELYAKGRTAPGEPCNHPGGVRAVGDCLEHPLGLPVTKARPGYSWHQYAMAADLVPDDPTKPGYQPVWDADHPHYGRLITVAQSKGLVCGAEFRTFPDYPHVQYTGRFPVSPTDEVRQLFTDGGMIEVWRAAFSGGME